MNTSELKLIVKEGNWDSCKETPLELISQGEKKKKEKSSIFCILDTLEKGNLLTLFKSFYIDDKMRRTLYSFKGVERKKIKKCFYLTAASPSYF